jgi:predicted protein tyrosine phosphatase
MNVRIMSKMECIQYTYSDKVKPCVIISINCPSELPPRLLNHDNIKTVMYLYFDDIEQRHIELGSNLKLMEEVDVGRIYGLIKLCSEDKEVEEIIVHCHAGISRSSAVAAGICLMLKQDDMWIWEGGYVPNRHVFTMMNSKIGLSKEEIDYRYEVNHTAHQKEEYSWINDMSIDIDKFK